MATQRHIWNLNLTDVLACLTRAVGTNGCGYEHQLQSLRAALNPQVGINDANVGFLRSEAKLAIVILTDEDDCSADTDDTKNDGMFMRSNPGDAASLRCAARGHVCNGQPIPDYDPTNGYSGAGFTANLADCAPKDQLDPNHPDPTYLPLIRVKDIIDGVNSAKTRPTGQILVSGINSYVQWRLPPAARRATLLGDLAG